MIIERKACTHLIAQCRQCDWRSEDFKNGGTKAKKHVASTGHAVVVEEAVFYWIKP